MGCLIQADLECENYKVVKSNPEQTNKNKIFQGFEKINVALIWFESPFLS